MNSNASVRIGVFSSQKTAQLFFESLPERFQNTIGEEQLWLNAYRSNSGFTEHQLEISGLDQNVAQTLCEIVETKNAQCISSTRTKWVPKKLPLPKQKPSEDLTSAVFEKSPEKTYIPILKPLGIRLTNSDLQGFELSLPEDQGEPYTQKRLETYANRFTLDPSTHDTIEVQAAKAAYDAARNRFIGALRNIGDGVNNGKGSEATRAELMALGRELFETAGSIYLSGFLEHEIGQAQALSAEANAGQTFIHHVQNNISNNARSTIEGLVTDLLSSATGAGDMQDDILKVTTDRFILSGAQGLIDAGLAAARRSDLYALRHMELEYNLNNFEDTYLRALITQPVYQSTDLRHNIFFQGGGILNEQSVDIDDDERRHTLNVGGAYRYFTVDEKHLLGANIFFDHQWPYNHSRMSVGVDAKAQDLNFAANYYYPLTDFKDSRRDANGNQYEERALEGYDIELGYTLPFLRDMSVFGKGYQYFRKTDDDIRGLELSAEYNIRDNFVVTGAFIEENGERDGVEFALQYRMPLYDTEKPNLALAAMEPAAGEPSLRSKIFEKVRRENRIRVEERQKTDDSAPLITAQFNALSIGLPFNVGGTLTGTGVNLPFDTAITVPNGDFGIMTFSNGAIANISASGVGDVILEFNNSTLTVTATNGGFVQFISGSGGISTVNVPGGTVNLLGTDIDVTDDGTTTTVQVRAGQIEVVPDVGAAVLNGNQGDVVSLTIASGATSLLVDPALETRQEAAFTNLDFINPDPPNIDSAAPFINALPSLITGPQFIGNNADIRVSLTQSVTVSGAPQLNGFIDANARTFIYNASASTSTQLVFRHVYIAGDVGAAGITIQELDLNGGTIIGTANGLNAVTAFTDTVIAITDLTSPSLLSSTPADNEPAFNSGANIVLNFDENVQANVGNIILTDTTDGSDTRVIPITDPQVSVVGSTVTINPTGILDLTTDYDLTIGANVIQDVSGNSFAGLTSGDLNFTTSNDVTPPMLTSTTPNDDDTSVAVGSNLVLNFDENIQAISGNIVITDTTDGSDTRNIPIGDAQVSIVGSTITINPTTDLEIGTAYDVTIATGVIEDLIGNDFTGITTGDFNFSTTPITSLAQVTGLADGNYLVTGDSQTFTGYVESDLGSSWLLVGRGREGWEFDSNGQGTNAAVATNLGVVAGFTPNAYEDDIINDIITNAAIDLTGVEIRIKRAADTTGTNYQNVLWRPTVQTAWIWSLDDPSPGYTVIHDVQASILGAASSSTRTTRDANAGNDWRRIFTWAWSGHGSQQGFSYGSGVGGVNGNDPNTFLWENGTENHAIPYTEVYIRVE